MELIDIDLGDRTYRDVWVPTRFSERWRGMKRRAGAMLFRGASVHGIGMDRRLRVVGLDASGHVIGVCTLERGRVVVMRGAAHLLELESDLAPPGVGSRARFYDRRNVGTTRGLRNADRQSGGHLRATRRDAPNR